MAAVIYRGSTCRIKFKPKNVDISALGTPTIVISQEYAYITPEVYIDTTNGVVFADLYQDDTIQLVENLETRAQLMFYDEETKAVTRFPVHYITVYPTLAWMIYEQPEEEEQQEQQEEQGE